MGRRFRAFIEEVRDAADIVSVIGADVSLSPAGKTLKGLSPFHTEKTPSFVVWPDTQSWHDFSNGGGLGGDVFAYIQQRDGGTFSDALGVLAAQHGIHSEHQDTEAARRELERLLERRAIERLLTQAAAHYHQALSSQIRNEWYRQHYGFTDETINELRLGWASGHLFSHFVDALKVERTLALKTGLFVVHGDRVEDFFRERLVFPYWQRGQVAYFIARSTQSTDPGRPCSKYTKLLTHSDRHSYVSETVRNDTFYNEDAARRTDELVITEGITDCISAWQAGIPCISPATTRFRTQDLPKLVQLTRRATRIIICNDAEASGAGTVGAVDTATALHAEGRDVRIAQLPRPEGVEKVDVNAFLKAHPLEAFQDVLGGARRFVQHLIEAIPAETPKVDLTPALQPVLSALGRCSAVERDGYVDLLVARFPVRRCDVQTMLREAAADERHTTPAAQRARTVGRPDVTPAATLRGEVFEAHDHYYVLGRDDEAVRISSFRIEPTTRIRLEDGEHIIGDVTTDSGRIFRDVRFPPQAWRSKRDFLQTFPSADMQWMGSDNNVQGVLGILARRPLALRTGTHELGYLDTPDGPRWVAQDSLFGPDGPCPDSPIVFVPNGSTFPGRVRYRSLDVDAARQLAQTVLPDLLALNEPAVLLTVLGWFCATPFKPRLMRRLGHFPILWVWGTQGSGKSTLIKEVFWRLFGVGSTEPYSATETEFALITLLASTNAVPVFIDEYRPTDMPRQRLHTLHRLMRRIYGGEVEERGRANLTVTSYRLSAPVCVAGEARPSDPALVDRLVSVMPDKNRLDGHPEHVAAYHRIQAADIARFTTPYLQWTLSRETETDLRAAAQTTDQVLRAVPGGESISRRCRDNLCVIVFGLSMFKAFAVHLGVTEMPDLDIEAALSASIADLMDGEQGAKNPLDLFVETCSVLAYDGRLFARRHYVVVDGLTCASICGRAGRSTSSTSGASARWRPQLTSASFAGCCARTTSAAAT